MRFCALSTIWLTTASFALRRGQTQTAGRPRQRNHDPDLWRLSWSGDCCGKRLDRDGWSQIVVNMIQRGAQGSDDEFADIVDYLTNTVSAELAKINVNKATANQLQTGLAYFR